MAKIQQFLINGKTYKVQTLSVLDTLYFQAELVTTIGTSLGELADIIQKSKNKDGKIDVGNMEIGEFGGALSKIDPAKLRKIQPKIFAQVITPENKFLGDEVTIEEWFSREENAGDVWGVLIRATAYLLGEYLPNFFRDMIQNKTEVRTK